MPCATGELCTIPSLTPEPPDRHVSSGGYAGRLHGFCGEVEEPDGDVPHLSGVRCCQVLHEGCRESPHGQTLKHRQGGPWGGTVEELEVWFRKNG